jgi:hypothetical protein
MPLGDLYEASSMLQLVCAVYDADDYNVDKMICIYHVFSPRTMIVHHTW